MSTPNIDPSEEIPAKAPLLALEAAPVRDPNAPIQLNVATSEPVSLYDQLGPAIVAKDGTLTRIANWGEMKERERTNILRVLGARNKIRLENRKQELELEEAKNRE